MPPSEALTAMVSMFAGRVDDDSYNGAEVPSTNAIYQFHINAVKAAAERSKELSKE